MSNILACIRESDDLFALTTDKLVRKTVAEAYDAAVLLVGQGDVPRLVHFYNQGELLWQTTITPGEHHETD